VISHRSRSKPLGYTDGIVSGGIIEVAPTKLPHLEQPPEWARTAAYILHATTNGQTWSYELHRGWMQSGEGSIRLRHPSDIAPVMAKQQQGLNALPEVEDLLAWALKDAIKRKAQPLAPYAVATEQAVKSIKLPGPRGPITYFGYGKKVGAYTLAQIHEAVAKAVADCSGIWKWATGGPWCPSNLQVKIHTGKVAMGLAWNPGSGKELNKRIFSLNKLLFTGHDANSIWRVVVHELCHHYRDEALPLRDFDDEDSKVLRGQLLVKIREKRSFAAAMNIVNSHDIRFVKALGQVDPTVATTPVEACWFTEYVDKSVVAVVEQQKGVQWAAGAGKLVLKWGKSTMSASWNGAWGKHSLGLAGIETVTKKFQPFDDIRDKVPEGFDAIRVEFDDKIRKRFELIYRISSGKDIQLPNDLPMSVALPLLRTLWRTP
jgi:hypothetical protein